MVANSRAKAKKGGGTAKRPPKVVKEVQMFVRVPEDVRDALKELADKDERSLAKYHARLLKEHVEREPTSKEI